MAWNTAGWAPPPAAQASATDQASADGQASAGDPPPVALPGPGQTVSFEAHIKPLFRPRDRQSMTFAFDLWSYADVKANAAGIAERLRNGTMPCDGAWPPDKIDAFSRWTESGFPP